MARQRVAAAGLSDRVDIRLQDYRDVDEKFDRIVSVGMFEHVGLKNLRGYFAKTRKLLGDGGICMNHGITSTDPDSAESPFGGGEFIGGRVSPIGAVIGALTLTLAGSFLSFLRISPDWQIGAQGAILIVVLALRLLLRRIETREQAR